MKPTGRRRTRLGLVVACLAVILPFGIPIAAKAAIVPTVTAIAAGYSFTCEITSDGGVKCWGLVPEIGGHPTPESIAGLSSGVTSITAGLDHACALLTTGGIKCWGRNDGGQLGDGTTSSRATPMYVSGLTSGVVGIAAGRGHTCAVLRGGEVKCWGYNHAGQLGDGTTTNRLTPVNVAGLASSVMTVTAGFVHTCALTFTGRAQCWGANYLGQLGDGTTGASLTPRTVSGLATGVAALAAGFSHTCAVTTTGAAKCWGYGVYGKLGNGSTTSSPVPVTVVGLASGVSAVSVGSNHSCAVRHGGGLSCWGYNAYGQVGDGTKTTRWAPVDVLDTNDTFTAVAVGELHACALTSAGVVKCWGHNFYSQLGNGTVGNSTVPVPVGFATHETIVLGASEAAATIAPGTAVTFLGFVQPLPRGTRATVRFEIYRQDSGVWRLAARRDVRADATGRATLDWTFVTTGPRYVRARALSNATYAASRWSRQVHYLVG